MRASAVSWRAAISGQRRKRNLPRCDIGLADSLCTPPECCQA
jgi:hypothetical protein